MTRTGMESAISVIRSKKWQHFSTNVPPEFLLNRFQLFTWNHNLWILAFFQILKTLMLPPNTADFNNNSKGSNEIQWGCTFTRNGNRCSRMETMRTRPTELILTCSMSFATAGIYRYSNPTCTKTSGRACAASITYVCKGIFRWASNSKFLMSKQLFIWTIQQSLWEEGWRGLTL